MLRNRLWIVFAALFTLSACGVTGGGVRMTQINSEQKKPNNVWVFFAVDKGGEPLPGLEAKDFEIYEDDKLVSVYESKQVIQNPEVAAVMYTLLLLDVSGSITESGQIEPLTDAAEVFTEKVGKTQKVAVYAFDGSEDIRPVVPFTEREGTLKGGLKGLRSYKPKDPSTNLHGAVIQGLRVLKEDLDADSKPLKFGTLVVFSDGADRAARVSRDEMVDEIRKDDYDNYQMFAIGIGDPKELEEAQLEDIGRDGTEIGSDRSNVQDSFDKVAGKIEAHTKRFYLLSYCTPARKGDHEVRIEFDHEKKGSGSLEYTFNADGFGPPPECQPDRAPSFDLDPASTDEDDDDGRSRGRFGGR